MKVKQLTKDDAQSMVHIINNSPVDYCVNDREFVEVIYHEYAQRFCSSNIGRLTVYKAGLINGIRQERERRNTSKLYNLTETLSDKNLEILCCFAKGLLRNGYQ